MDVDAIWQIHLWMQWDYCVRWGPWPQGKGRFKGRKMLPNYEKWFVIHQVAASLIDSAFTKLLWSLMRSLTTYNYCGLTIDFWFGRWENSRSISKSIAAARYRRAIGSVLRQVALNRITFIPLQFADPVPHYRIAPQKSIKNPPCPAAAWTGRIFTGKLSAGGDFSGGARSYRPNGETFYEAGDISIKGRSINSVIISFRADFS